MKKNSKGFSLVELVIVIIVILMLILIIFAGGTAVQKKSRISRATSDMYNIRISLEQTLNEVPEASKIYNNNLNDDNLKRLLKVLNNNLPQGYKISPDIPLTSQSIKNIDIIADAQNTGVYLVYQTDKLDPWDNNYYLLLDCSDRYSQSSNFTITTISAGPNGKTLIGSNEDYIDTDDIFMISEQHNGDVTVKLYNAAEIKTFTYETQTLKIKGHSDDNVPIATYTGENAVKAKSTITEQTGSGNSNNHHNSGGNGGQNPVSKTTNVIDLSKDTVVIKPGQSVDISAFTLGSATIQVQSENESIASVSLDGSTITIHGVSEGSTIVNVMVPEQTNYTAANRQINVSVSNIIYTVTFNTNGGSLIEPQDVAGGNAAIMPANPQKSNYTFRGWTTESTAKLSDPEYNFDTILTNNITLYAKWEENLTVTFNSNGGSAVEYQQLTNGSKATEPSTPVKTGYIFAGWSAVPDGYTQLDYVESNGSQYINTGILPNINTVVMGNLKVNGTGVGGYNMSGSAGDDYALCSAISFGVHLPTTSDLASVFIGDTVIGQVNLLQDNNFHIYYASSDIRKIDSATESINNVTNYVDSTGRPFYLFAYNESGTIRYASQSIKWFKFNNKDGEALADYVPARRNSDNALGMYDLVSESFISSTGTLVSGTEATYDFNTPVTSDFTLYAKWTRNPNVEVDIPAGYTKLTYLQSTGTEYIDTELSMPNGFRTVGSANLLNLDEDKEIIGAWDPNAAYRERNGLDYYNTTGTFTFSSGGLINKYNSPTANTWFSFDASNINDMYLKIGNEVVSSTGTVTNAYTNGVQTPRTTANLTIFAVNQENSTPVVLSKLQLADMSVYDEHDSIVAKMHPVRRNSDNKLGMYDTVRDVFLPMQGGDGIPGPVADPVVTFMNGDSVYTTKTTTYGGTVSAPAEPTKAGYVFKGWQVVKNHEMPAGYTQLQYLESTGSQYIDTGVVTNDSLVIETNLAFPEVYHDDGDPYADSGGSIGTNDGYWKGAINISSNNGLSVIYYGEDDGDTYPASSYTKRAKMSYDNLFHEYYLANGEQRIDRITGDVPVRHFMSSLNWYAFGRNQGYSPYLACAKVQIRYITITDHGTVVRRMVAARRNSDGVLGMYDLKNNQFYTNNGSGNFVVGPALSNFDFSTAINGDTILYAVWEEDLSTQAVAMLYDTNSDGHGDKLVFQRGNTRDPAEGTFVKSYTGFENNEDPYTRTQKIYSQSGIWLKYIDTCAAPWFEGTATTSIPSTSADYITTVEFKDVISPKTTACWFAGFRRLTTINTIANLNTSDVTNMSYMFSGCESLTGLDVSNFDTSEVTDMSSMFCMCRSMTTLNLNNFDTANVIDLTSMFDDCDALTSINLSSFNTSKVTSLDSMFHGCQSLTTLDLSSFDTSHVTDIHNFAKFCNTLTTIYASNSWDSSGFATAMDTYSFQEISALKGGNGTRATTMSGRTDLANIWRIDRDGQPGLLTYREPIDWDTGNRLYVIKNGVVNPAMPGDWSYWNYFGTNANKYDLGFNYDSANGAIDMVGTSESRDYDAVYSYPLDLTQYDKMGVKFNVYRPINGPGSYTYSNHGGFWPCFVDEFNAAANTEGEIGLNGQETNGSWYTINQLHEVVQEYDIADINDTSSYLCLHLCKCAAYVYDVWLEKEAVVETSIPTGYTELESITATGTQYIKTGLTDLTGGFRLITDIEVHDYGSGHTGGTIFGSHEVSYSSPWPYARNLVGYGPGSLWVTNTEGFIIGVAEAYVGEYDIESDVTYHLESSTLLDNYYIKVNNGANLELYRDDQGTGGRSPRENYLFACNFGGNATFLVRCTIHGHTKIYTSADDSELVAEFVPARRNSDGVVGMYDIVRNQFFTNAGTGSFIGQLEMDLPAGYTQLDYLESDGSSFIITSLKLQTGFHAICDVMKVADSPIYNMGGIFGAQDNVSNNRNWFGFHGSGWGAGKNGWGENGSANLNQLYHVEANTLGTDPILHVDGINVPINIASADRGTASNTGYLGLFCINYKNQTEIWTMPIRIYGPFYVYSTADTSILTACFVPAKRTSDGVLGMYDTVANKFYTNNGTGTFK